jgi:enterochelin esterase family protein
MVTIRSPKKRRQEPALTLLVLAGLAAATAATWAAEPSVPAPPGRLVDLGGRRLHLHCMGSGSPAVIVENGNSSFSIDFALVQPEVAKFTQICTYDRAGYAWSDPGPTQGTVEQTVDDLHLLLRKAGIRPPYVLVGASIGGIFTRAYQRRYPDEVVGLVLDDPTSDEGFSYRIRGKDKPIYEMSAADMRESGEAFLRHPPPPPQLPTRLEEPEDRLPKDLHAAWLWAHRKYLADRDLASLVRITNESWRQEFIALRRERLRQAHALGSLPLVVLGRKQSDDATRRVHLKEMAALSSAGKLIIAENSGHEIHLYRPELVVQAIREVVTAARQKQAGSEPAVQPVIDSPRLLALWRELQGGRRDALDRFWQEVQGKAPLVEPVANDDKDYWVTYVWRGDQQTALVRLFGGLPSYIPKDLKRLPQTDLWYWTERVPIDARYGYGFLVNPRAGVRASLRPDPLGRRVYAERSVVELPAAPPQRWSEPLEGVRQGKREAHKIPSAALKMERAVTVYTPAGYDPKGKECGLLVVFDGEASGGDLTGFNPIPGHVILDNLIAKERIAPVVAVFVESGPTRDRDLGCSAAFVDFLAKELLPWVHSRYHVSSDPARTVVAGVSRGGLAAAYCAWRHPELFGNVLAQSGAFWWYPEADEDRKERGRGARRLIEREPGWLTRQFAQHPRQPVRFYLEAGTFELDLAGGICTESRRLRDVLQAKGYSVIYREYNGDHDDIAWRGSFADGLLALLGAGKAETTP